VQDSSLLQGPLKKRRKLNMKAVKLEEKENGEKEGFHSIGNFAAISPSKKFRILFFGRRKKNIPLSAKKGKMKASGRKKTSRRELGGESSKTTSFKGNELFRSWFVKRGGACKPPGQKRKILLTGGARKSPEDSSNPENAWSVRLYQGEKV